MKKLSLFWKSLTAEEKLLALYIVAFFNTESFVFLIGAKKVLYTDAIFVLLLFVYGWKLLREKRPLPVTDLAKPLILMVVLFVVSFFNSMNLLDSAIEMLGLVYLIFLFIIFQDIIRTPKKLNLFLYLWMVMACAISLVGLFAFCQALINQNLAGNKFLYYDTITLMAHHFPRIDSTFANANMFCTYLQASLVFASILFLSEDNPKRKFLTAVCMSILLVAAFLTGSRRFTGLLLSLVIILSWYGRGRTSWIFKQVSFCGLALFLIAFIATTVWAIFPLEIKREEQAKMISVRAHYAYSIHLLQVLPAINMVKKHPFIGVGLGTYNRHFKENLDWEWARRSFDLEAYAGYIKPIKNKTLNFDPHSVFLGTLAETGFVGFLGLLYFLTNYIRVLLKRFKTSRERSFEKILSGCVLAGFVGFLLNGLVTDILSMRHFWIMMAIGMAMSGKGGEKKYEDS